MKDNLVKMGAVASAIMACLTILSLVFVVVRLVDAMTTLPTANAALIQQQAERIERVSANDAATIAALRYQIMRSHCEYTEQGYIRRTTLQYFLDMHKSLYEMEYDEFIHQLVEEVRKLPIDTSSGVNLVDTSSYSQTYPP